MSENNVKKMIPSELRLTQKWDFAIEQFAFKSVVGFGVAGVMSIVLFRTRHNRLAFSCLGLGVGLGDAYRTSNFAFEKENAEGNSK